MHIIQLSHRFRSRRVAIVEEPNVILLKDTVGCSYELFSAVINKKTYHSIDSLKSSEILNYDDIYNAKNEWRILPPIDCPGSPMHCILSGSGLTPEVVATTSGRSKSIDLGLKPEWFYKGNGSELKGHRQPVVVPNYSDEADDEPEIAGVYIIANDRTPVRLGFTQANEFGDHTIEEKNHLPPVTSNIRNSSIGPELIVMEDFDSFNGVISVSRDAKKIWSKSIHTGEISIAQSLEVLEHHHFKYAQHRVPGSLHVHFFGIVDFSVGKNIKLQQSDEMTVSFEKMGRPLINSLHIDTSRQIFQKVKTLQFS